ncbi:MAG: alternate-type signal peptide domain-containing protein [Rhodococcus sp. (in: high G+C Gram-positive bacteria)]
MNKATKGAVAAGGAAVLLLGGLGSFALWQDSTDTEGGTITSGELDIEPDGTPVWREISGDVNAASVIDPVTYRIVPGDIIEFTADYNILAEGDNLLADLKADTATITGDAALRSAIGTPTVTATSGGTQLPTDGTSARITSEDQDVQVKVTFTFNEATTDQIAQNETLNLENFTLDLVQVRP